jgi:asparagine synthase (glutamine-hydrolysing)
VEGCVEGEAKVAVAFSGGLDSSVLVACAKRRAEVVACSAYVDGSLDSSRAGKAAEVLGVEFLGTVLTQRMVSDAAEKTALPFEPSLMDRSLWCLYSTVSQSAMRAGARVVLLGQLADELFGGYYKYQRALETGGEESAAQAMRRDVAGYATAGMGRDSRACEPWAEARLPFMEEGVVELGLSLPVGYKLRDGVRKAVLRRAAEILGVPEELAGAGKKAAQYSSGVQKSLRRLTLLTASSRAGP